MIQSCNCDYAGTVIFAISGFILLALATSVDAGALRYLRIDRGAFWIH